MGNFDEYLKSQNQLSDLHDPELIQHIDQLELKNTIFYGPPGTGKYSLILKYIQKYSETHLKYCRKFSLVFDSKPYQFQISDVHYEIDMSVLSYNSKILWHEIYQQLVDIITNKGKPGIILCKYFHEINNDILDNFYNYMHHPNITFVIMTENVSFIPDHIIQSCQMVCVPRLSRENYTRVFDISNSSSTTITIPATTNIVNMKSQYLNPTYIPICNQIIRYMEDIPNFDYFTFRTKLYTLLVYNIDVYSSMWYILYYFIDNRQFSREFISNVLVHLIRFLHRYNNNHHNIYHIEHFLCYLQNQLVAM